MQTPDFLCRTSFLCKAGPRDGVYAFKKIGWGAKGRRKLPDGARFVAFPGRDPGKYFETDWIQKHWVGLC